MKPPADEALTKKELEVVQILRNFHTLVLEAESRRLPDFLRWGVRRRRSALNDDSPLVDPPPPPPPPPAPSSISPPPDGNDEGKDGDRGDAGGGATSSPESPFSFPASGKEPTDGLPPRPPSSTPVKVFKKNKRHVEWVKEQNQLIASLADENVQLRRSIAEYKSLSENFKAKNSCVHEPLQSKVMGESMEEEGQRQGHLPDGSFGLASVGPATLQSPATRSSVGTHSKLSEILPPPMARIAGGGTPSPSVAAAGGWPVKRAALDLNQSPVEEEEEGEWEQSSAYIAAVSAQARKRRPEINREMNNGCSSPPPPLFSLARKVPRLR